MKARLYFLLQAIWFSAATLVCFLMGFPPTLPYVLHPSTCLALSSLLCWFLIGLKDWRNERAKRIRENVKEVRCAHCFALLAACNGCTEIERAGFEQYKAGQYLER